MDMKEPQKLPSIVRLKDLYRSCLAEAETPRYRITTKPLPYDSFARKKGGSEREDEAINADVVLQRSMCRKMSWQGKQQGGDTKESPRRNRRR
ncbi:hypothetical protein ZHAS_00011210 [Anopheles sinensis]|uniref:Uncharacterized protein n=1 Tax=Anopheles sinensis TaxID=74873 RepID=A0A084VZL8_ANOSI|nr:hypothetical protein ZHAS_00011210 [Anopheles sinensis]